MRMRELGLAVWSLALVAGAVEAQDTRTSIAMAAGSATDVAGTTSSALTVSPSLVTGRATSTFSLVGNATRFTSRAWSASLGAMFSGRGGEGAVAPTIDLTGSGAATSYSFSYLTADATPALEARLGQIRLFGGAHVATASTSGIIRSPAQSLGGLSPLDTRSAATRTSASAVGGIAAGFSDENGESVGLTYRGEQGNVAGVRQTDHTFSATFGSEQIAIGGSVGRRLTAADAVTFGSGSLTIGLSPRVALQFAAGSYATNPMLATPGGQFVNAGMSVRLGGVAPSLPRPAGVSPVGRGMTRVSLRAEDATRVEIAGDFNHWDFIPAQRASNGVWYVDLRLPAGQYRYSFRVNGTEWRIPAGVPAAKDDEFGGTSAWLTVSSTAGGPIK